MMATSIVGLGTSFLACLILATTTAEASGRNETPSDPVRDSVLDKNDLGMRFLPGLLARRPMPRSVGVGPGVDVDLGGWNEPTIVVNPTDPLNIAYASLLELQVSTDGGASWSGPVPMEVPEAYQFGGDPSLAFDSQGRLFWSYLGIALGDYIFGVGRDLFVAQCDPTTGAILTGYPTNVTAQIGLPGSAGNYHDKEWLAADTFASSPFRDRLYLVWTRFPPVGNEVTMSTFSSDQGLTWSPPVQLSGSGSTFKWPAHVTVAPSGDVYAADHRQPGFLPATDNLVPDGISGRVMVYRSTDGGVTFPQSSLAYTAGQADMTWNFQSYPQGAIPGTDFLLRGSTQPWVLADPNTAGRIFVVANDDPDNDVGSGDAADVFIVISTDHGQTWSSPNRIDSGPGTSFQVMPTATIEKDTGAIVVHYYDNRNGAVNDSLNFLLDVFATVSLDGGITFGQDFQINDVPFDPNAGARCRHNCGPNMTDVWAGDSTAYAVDGVGHLLRHDGSGWTTIPGPLARKWAVWGSSDTDVFLCGDAGEILHYDGVQMTSIASGTTDNLYGMDGGAPDNIWAVGANGTIRRFDGISWSGVTSGTTEELHDVWVNPVGDVFIGGRNGTVLRCIGESCSSIGPLSDEDLAGVGGTSDSSVYAVSWTGGLYHYDGSGWETLDSGLDFLSGVWASAPDDVIATSFGQILRYDGDRWRRESVTEHLAWKIHGSSASNVFTVGEQTFIGHYDGLAWERQENPWSTSFPTLRIGEYNGVAAAGGRSFAVWCGNTFDEFEEPWDQQTIFDAFDTPWQVGISLVDLAEESSSSVILERGRPNPSEGPTSFAYSLPQAEHVCLSLVDVRGRGVTTLIHGDQPAGRHVVPWDGRDRMGDAAAPGVYFLRLEAGNAVRTQKVVLAR